MSEYITEITRVQCEHCGQTWNSTYVTNGVCMLCEEASEDALAEPQTCTTCGEPVAEIVDDFGPTGNLIHLNETYDHIVRVDHEEDAPCCYGFVTSGGVVHEPDCPEVSR